MPMTELKIADQSCSLLHDMSVSTPHARAESELPPVPDLKLIPPASALKSAELEHAASNGLCDRRGCSEGFWVSDVGNLEVIAPHISRRQSGVTATLERVLPAQAKYFSIATLGSHLPPTTPRIRSFDLLKLREPPPSGRPRIWHARRNIEMLVGVLLRDVFGFPLRLVFTSASQRHHTRWTRALIARMDGLIATSRATAGYLKHPATVITHGIDSDIFSPCLDKGILRQQLGLPSLKLVGCFGRIRERKGSDVFVDALLSIMSSRADVGAVLLGHSTSQHLPFLQEQKDKIRSSGVSDRFFILPEVTTSEMPNWYRALDIYVAPQRWEGFGVTPLEAMASGIPVVATRVGAFPNILTSDTGILVEPGNPGDMVTAISTMLDEPWRMQEMGQAGRERVLHHFSIDEEARQINQVYREIWSETNIVPDQ